jgi:hypothetical protein
LSNSSTAIFNPFRDAKFSRSGPSRHIPVDDSFSAQAFADFDIDLGPCSPRLVLGLSPISIHFLAERGRVFLSRTDPTARLPLISRGLLLHLPQRATEKVDNWVLLRAGWASA